MGLVVAQVVIIRALGGFDVDSMLSIVGHMNLFACRLDKPINKGGQSTITLTNHFKHIIWGDHLPLEANVTTFVVDLIVTQSKHILIEIRLCKNLQQLFCF